MAIFIKLLETKIVANNFLGLANNRWTMANFFAIDFSSLVSKSDGVKEKKATSAPEITAEQKSKTKIKTPLVIWVKSKTAKKSKPGGSMSNLLGLVKR